MPKAKYIDKAGRLAVMGEFALRGFNIAETEFDHCKDLIVLNDRSGAMFRVYVQSVLARKGKTKATARFRIPKRVYSLQRVPQRRFVLALRLDDHWRYLIFTDEELRCWAQKKKLGELQKPKRGEPVFSIDIEITPDGTPHFARHPSFDLAFYFERWDLWSEPGKATLED